MHNAMFKIAETFRSVQGEGSQAGQAAFFIRFYGCNLNCNFGNGLYCDDMAHKAGYDTLTLFQLETMIRTGDTDRDKIHNVIITGGECTLDDNLPTLISYLKSVGFHVAVETNGERIELASEADLITYSPKKGGRQLNFTEADALGILDKLELKLLAGAYNEVDTKWNDYPLKFLQAIGGEHDFYDANMKYCVDYVTWHPEWHLSTQIQKLYKVD